MFAAARQALDAGVRSRVFPGASIEVGTATRILWSDAVGRLSYDSDARDTTTDTIFDLASLTKVLATTPLVMQQIEQGRLALDDRVAAHVPAWTAADRADVTIRDLLSHCSGLPSHRPYYERLQGVAAFEQAICREPLEYVPRRQAIYSDLGFILLGCLLTRDVDFSTKFATLTSQMQIADPLQFAPPDSWRPRIAPTADDPWRGRRLVGEVDDDNAAAMGGLAGHAGVFGTAPAVGASARHLLQILDGRRGAFGRDTLRTFIQRRSDVPGSSRALGWDTMLPTSSCGGLMSPEAFGHTGSTGTSLWIDPERGVYVVLLTNRVHPNRQDRGIQAVRRGVHDAVMTAVLMEGLG